MAPPAPPPELMEELVEEILLRFPPDDPASLFRAALVCKLWCRLDCGVAFRRRFREFHFHRGVATPLLGLVYGDTSNVRRDGTPRDPYLVCIQPVFVPMTSFRSAHAVAGRSGWGAIDARHGRVLLCRRDPSTDWHDHFCVWDPVTDEQQHLPKPPFDLDGLSAAVACGATAAGDDCDHLDCHRGPFLVVVTDIQEKNMYLSSMYLAVYSSDAGVWSKLTAWEHPTNDIDALSIFNNMPGVLVWSALYFLLQFTDEIVKYDLVTREVSTIPLPSKVDHLQGSIVLMTADDGGLGFVGNTEYKLELWSRVAGPDEDAGFVLSRVIDLRKMLLCGALIKKKPYVNGFAVEPAGSCS